MKSLNSRFPVPPLRWLVAAEPDPEVVQALARGLTVTPSLAALLAQRGLATPEAARRFLRPVLEELADPLQLKGMAEAVDTIATVITPGMHNVG